MNNHTARDLYDPARYLLELYTDVRFVRDTTSLQFTRASFTVTVHFHLLDPYLLLRSSETPLLLSPRVPSVLGNLAVASMALLLVPFPRPAPFSSPRIPRVLLDPPRPLSSAQH